jgi:hypothetical protein
MTKKNVMIKNALLYNITNNYIQLLMITEKTA